MGEHKPWVNYGGSAGLYAADIFEGVKPPSNETGVTLWRDWRVELLELEMVKAKKQTAIATAKLTVLESRKDAIKTRGEPVFKQDIANNLCLDRTSTRFKSPWDDLVREGRIKHDVRNSFGRRDSTKSKGRNMNSFFISAVSGDARNVMMRCRDANASHRGYGDEVASAYVRRCHNIASWQHSFMIQRKHRGLARRTSLVRSGEKGCRRCDDNPRARY